MLSRNSESKTLSAQLKLACPIESDTFDANPQAVQGITVFNDPATSIVLIEPRVFGIEKRVTRDCLQATR